MGIQILSPSTYVQENDLSFVAPGLGAIGAVIVGPTTKGQAFVPTQINAYSDFVAQFGPEYIRSYTPYTVKNYLRSSGVVTVMRVLGNGGWRFDGSTKQLSAITSGSRIIAAFHPSQNVNAAQAELSQTTAVGTFQQFNLTLSGSQVFTRTSASLNYTSPYFISRVIGNNPNNNTGSAYPYVLFNNYFSASVAIGSSSYAAAPTLVVSTTPCTFTGSNASGYAEAITPWIVSATGVRLFRVHHISQGDLSNRDVKIGISNINISSTSGIDSTFSLIVRQYSDTDNLPSVLEQYNNVSVNLNTVSAVYLSKAVGTKYQAYNAVLGKVVETGEYANISSYIRIEESPQVKAGALDSTVYPAGFEGVFETITGFNGFGLPVASNIQSNSGSAIFSGFDYSNTDNLNYLNPIPLEATQGLNVTFFVTSSDNKFIVPMQGGLDGMNYATIQNTGLNIVSNNVFGFDLSSPTAGGALSYIQALNILSSKESYQFNVLAIPGVLQSLHPSVTSYAISTITNRGDAIYIMDLCGANDTIATAVATTSGIDSNYTATYYPWLRIVDSVTNKVISVPPSTVIPGVYAYSDQISAEWYAPAGINRGGIGSVQDVVVKLSKADRDLLYPARINPIASFPNTGITVWGQKTLQVKDSALNRINVRRLMINIERFFVNAGNNIIFEPNTNVTRNNFLNIVNPYLSQVQAKQGLYAAKVIMDDSNNTPDAIDRNLFVVDVFVQPVKAGEFFIMTFNVEPTGVSLT
jgi:hypothetical protein